jgi:nucleoside-diphosphate-sugar epimerase
MERRYDLVGPIDPGLLASVDVLVHTAYDFSLTNRKAIWRVNVQGTRRLLAAAQDAGVRRILVLSTMSAYEGTQQLYGQAKLAIEAATAAVGGCSIRPGLVYGNQPGGMAGALRKITKLPLIPLIAADARQYPVLEADLMTAVAVFAEAEDIPAGPIGVAQSSPVQFRDLLLALAAQEGRHCRFIPFPWQLVYAALRVGEFFRLRMPFRADSLLGLVRSAPFVPGSEELTRLGVHLIPFTTYAVPPAPEPGKTTTARR